MSVANREGIYGPVKNPFKRVDTSDPSNPEYRTYNAPAYNPPASGPAAAGGANPWPAPSQGMLWGNQGGGGTPGHTPAPHAPPAQAGQVNPGQAYAPLRQVQPNETVQHQLKGLLNSDSAYMQNARLRGAQYANKRGLLNSSLGAQASQQAALEQAIPIAQQDAETWAAAAAGNQKSELDTRLANLDIGTRAQVANLDAATQVGLANLDSRTKVNLANLDNETQAYMANLDAMTKEKLEIIGGNYRVLMSTNEYAQGVFREVSKNIAAIHTSQRSGKVKAAAIDYQLWMLRNAMDQLGGVSKSSPSNLRNLDLSKYFNRH